MSSTRTVRTAALGAVGLASIVGVGVLVALNPSAPSGDTVRVAQAEPQELLADPAITADPSSGPWASSVPGGVVARRRGWAHLRGTVRQEVPLTAVAGQAYRFTVRLRTDGDAGAARVDGAVQVQTACRDAGEVTRTAFVASAAWQDVSATLTASRPEGCSLRVVIEAGPSDGSGPGIDVDGTSLRVGVLADPSFEVHAPDADGGLAGPWQAEGLQVAPATADVLDGARAVRVTAGPQGGTLRQRVRLDASSEPVLARAEVGVRVTDGPAAAVRLGVSRPCATDPAGGDAGAAAATATATVGPSDGWHRLVARQVPRRAADGLPADPPGIIRPDGVGCTLEVTVRVAPGATVELDGADLRLDPFLPVWGSERTRRAEARAREATRPTTPIDQRMGGSVDGAASAGGS